MTQRLAQAWDRENTVMVDVISAYDGEWLVENQWTQERYTVEFAQLHALWANPDVIETFDEFVHAWDVAFAYHLVRIITRNAEWAQSVARQWADTY
jgi:hypothetical protein